MEATVMSSLLGNGSDSSECSRLVQLLGQKRNITKSGDELDCN